MINVTNFRNQRLSFMQINAAFRTGDIEYRKERQRKGKELSFANKEDRITNIVKSRILVCAFLQFFYHHRWSSLPSESVCFAILSISPSPLESPVMSVSWTIVEFQFPTT